MPQASARKVSRRLAGSSGEGAQRRKSGEGTVVSPEERVRIVAQRLFSQFGFNGVSLRTITDEAKVNIAAVNYYYGSKNNLYAAVVKHHMSAVLKERIDRLRTLEEKLDRGGKPPSLRLVLESWLVPTLDLYYRDDREGPAIVRLAMQLDSVVGPDGLAKVLEAYDEYHRRMCRMLNQCVPEMSADKMTWRFENVLGMIFYLLGQPDWQLRVPSKYCSIEDRQLMHERLMESALALCRP